ncbi:peptide/nickel transport system substrate-binding protein [Paraburkholderia sp. BL6665CI2N2]|uniref:ABC transporter substrate-binding protein n=1 Tax=Paraburkholderia sp. BL6665CI2N2 TaxID=1938806 RepID=UPI0010666E5F|nr:ABC transporter substrate-binding protein [Paraburkholderia sp. BL6665CI2N2]TDY22085.1 peptide/nickel transport system substrate-binding protein [Paraburkholderia sp. BL6665CI2N2]
MTKKNDPFHTIRDNGNEIQNHVIDEFLSGRLSRRELLRAGSMLGLWTLGGSGLIASLSSQAASPVAGTIRIGHPMPSGAIDPITAFDVASPALLNQSGEYLVNSDSVAATLRPALALSWMPNSKGDVWTFRLRKGVRFQNGQLLTAKDVAATFDRLTDPAAGSAAKATFRGVLSKGGTQARDENTVEFHLDAPNGSFPWYVSSDTINTVILPFDFKGAYEQSFPGTGPYRLERFQPRVGATFVRNDNYWGAKAKTERLEFKFYGDQQGQILAMQGREVDLLTRFTVHGGLALLNNAEFKVAGTRSSTHRQIHMRADQGVFKDKRIRQALALSLDREAMVRGLLMGRGVPANDHPFAPVFPTFDPSVPQKSKDLEGAKARLAAAGVGNGFSATLTTEAFLEMPDLAVVVQNAAKSIGANISLRVESQEAYYGSGTPGKSDWLDSPMGMTDYGHRGVPDSFLRGPLVSGGAWNAAHFTNAQYDQLVARYTATLEVREQKEIGGKIERLLTDEVPVAIPYFADSLIVTRANLEGVRFSAMAQLYLDQAVLS